MGFNNCQKILGKLDFCFFLHLDHFSAKKFQFFLENLAENCEIAGHFLVKHIKKLHVSTKFTHPAIQQPIQAFIFNIPPLLMKSIRIEFREGYQSNYWLLMLSLY